MRRYKFLGATALCAVSLPLMNVLIPEAAVAAEASVAAEAPALPVQTNLPKGFTDHGAVAPVSESRGVVAARDADGTPLVLAIARDLYKGGVRSSLLVINAKTGKTEQFWYPGEEATNGDPFHLMLAKSGRFYTMFGDTMMEFDIAARRWSAAKKAEGMAMSFAESSDGTIYFATYPKSKLFSFDPKTQTLTDLGQLDPQEQYPSSLAVGDDGWAYAGIGTARSNLVAFNVKTRERVQLAKEEGRKTGAGIVYRGQDGAIYGREFGALESPVLKLENGTATPYIGKDAPKKAVTGAISWGSILDEFPGGGRIKSFSLPDKTFAVTEADGTTRDVKFDYASTGAANSSMTAGPDGRIWGSTNHPMHFWSYDPARNEVHDWGGLAEVGGGNFPNLAVVGNKIVGATYSSGALWVFDTTRPWNNAQGDAPNPKLIGKFADIQRPRVAVAHPDGKTVILGGFPGYGKTGGGLVFFEVATEKATTLTSQDVLPGHSTVALRVLPDGTLVGGTSTEAPGGGHKLADRALLYLMDGTTHKVTFQIEPTKSGADIFALEIGPDGKVYGLTTAEEFFVFDPVTKKIVYTADWKEFGDTLHPGQSLWRGPDGRVYATLAKAILRVQPDYSPFKLADLPSGASAGIAVLNGRVYYASGPRLWSYDMQPHFQEKTR